MRGDHAGRRGLGIAFTHDALTSELIFNRQTGELLGEQGTANAGGTVHQTPTGDVLTEFAKGS